MAALSPAVRKWLQPLVAPAVFDFWAQKLSATLSWERCLARIVERHQEARDTITLTLKPNSLFGGFVPGQHANVSVWVGGIRLTRSYSPVSLPQADGSITITVKKIAGGVVSSWLVEQAQLGDVLEIGPGVAFGDMVLHAGAPQLPWLLVAGGSGITPLMCLARSLLKDNAAANVTLMVWARQREELCFQEALAQMKRDHPNFSVCTFLTREEVLFPGEDAGRPSAHGFVDRVADLSARHVRACGPAGFVQSVEQLLSEAVASFQCEAFTLPEWRAEDTGPVEIHLARSGGSVVVPAGQSLLESLEQAGLKPAFGCRRGICNTCSCEKSAGTVENIISGDLNGEAGPLKLCISAPKTDITLDL